MWLCQRSEKTSTQAQHDRAARALVAAARANDSAAVERMLHPGVALTVDGGGMVPAPRRPLRGASEVGAYLVAVLVDPATAPRVEAVNGLAGVVLRCARRVTGVLGIRVRKGRIVEAWLVVNPDKLTRWIG